LPFASAASSPSAPAEPTADFAAELESHVALHTDDGIRAGLTPAEARRQALIRLGGAEQTRQAHRERRTLPWLESLLRDFAYGLRTLGKHRGATAIAILSIGLGIGANATIFSMVSRFVLRPRRGRSHNAAHVHTTHDGDECCNNFPYPIYPTCAIRQSPSPASPLTMSSFPPPSAAAASRSASGARPSPPTSSTSLQLPMVVGRGFAQR
jgi:hypothetical protein